MQVSHTQPRNSLHRTVLRQRLQAKDTLSPRQLERFDRTPGTTAQDVIAVTAQQSDRAGRSAGRGLLGSLVGTVAAVGLLAVAPMLAVGAATVGATLAVKALMDVDKAIASAKLEDKLTEGLTQPTRQELDALPPPRPLTRRQLDALPPPQAPPWQPPTNAPQILSAV